MRVVLQPETEHLRELIRIICSRTPLVRHRVGFSSKQSKSTGGKTVEQYLARKAIRIVFLCIWTYSQIVDRSTKAGLGAADIKCNRCFLVTGQHRAFVWQA